VLFGDLEATQSASNRADKQKLPGALKVAAFLPLKI
jgi:hypothetical protein